MDRKSVVESRGEQKMGCGWWRVAIALVGLLVAAPCGLAAQGVRYDSIVLGPRGTPAGGATVAVCSAGASASTTPCAPLATVYSDEAMTEPLANPMPADSLGNYGFWAAPGHYLVQIYGGGISTKTMDIFLPCDPSNCLVSNATFSSITTGSLNLTGGLTVNGRGVATKPLASDAVAYVSPNGSDANDGLSWGTAKLTVAAACGALPGGNSVCSAGAGTIWVSPGWTGTKPAVSGSALHVYYLSDPIGGSSGSTGTGGAGGEAHPTDAIQYVSPSGSDTNDGLSWGTAKQTIYAATQYLIQTTANDGYEGGTVYIANGSACGGPVSGQGLWLYRTGASPGNGWLQIQGSMTFVGVGMTHWGGNGWAADWPNCGSATQPGLALQGINVPLKFENLGFSGSMGADLVSGVTTVTFEQDAFAVNNTSATNGPAVFVGPASFWLYFRHCVFSANSNSGVTHNGADSTESFVVNPGTTNPSAGFIFIDESVANGGGDVKWSPGNTSASLYVDGLSTEDQVDGHGAVWITAANTDSAMIVENVGVSDAVQENTPAVEVDSGSPDTTLVINAGGQGINTTGPMTVLGQYPHNIEQATSLPILQGVSSPLSGKSFYSTDAGRRMFSPVALRWANLAPQLPSAWHVDSGVGVTAVAAPDGTNNAGQLTNSSGSTGGAYPNYYTSMALSNGDYLLFGVWAKGIGNDLPYDVGPQGCSGISTTSLLPGLDWTIGGYIKSGAAGEWEWYVRAIQISGSSSACDINFMFRVYGNTSSGGPAYYAPTLVHIPASAGVTPSEAAMVALNLAPYPDSVSPPVEGTLRGHPLAFGGSGDNYFATLDHTALTANQTYTFPNASGTVALTLAGTTGSIGGSSLAGGACTTGTAPVSGATTAMAVTASPAADPGTGFTWEGWVSAAGTVTVRVCNVSGASATPTAAVYNVRVAE